MVLPPKDIHPKGDAESNLKKREISALVAIFEPVRQDSIVLSGRLLVSRTTSPSFSTGTAKIAS